MFSSLKRLLSIPQFEIVLYRKCTPSENPKHHMLLDKQKPEEGAYPVDYWHCLWQQPAKPSIPLVPGFLIRA